MKYEILINKNLCHIELGYYDFRLSWENGIIAFNHKNELVIESSPLHQSGDMWEYGLKDVKKTLLQMDDYMKFVNFMVDEVLKHGGTESYIKYLKENYALLKE